MSAVAEGVALVGRAEELDRLESALARAPATILVGGEAGVGKTRLVKEFGARVRAAGARLLVGGCLELGPDGLPYAPFTAVLRGLVRELGIDGVAGLLPPAASGGLARLLPEFGEPETDTASGEERARLFELMLTLLERLAEDGTVALVIEDVHWADRSTRDLLTFLIRNLGAARVLVVVTYRTDELHRDHPMRPLLAGLDRVERVRRVELARLSRGQVGELARHILGKDPEISLVDKVHRRSEGNPLFVEMLLDCDGGPAGVLPESLRDLLLAGVRGLPEETQEALRLATAGGTRIDHDLLAAVTGLADAALTRVLRPAVLRNVLVVDGDGYAFRHALIREAVHLDLLPGEHTALHARYAEAMEDDPTLVPAGRLWAELTLHWMSAHDSGRALVGAWKAADAAGRSLAHAEGLAMLDRVLELWDRVPDAAERIGARHLHVLERAARAAELAGEYDRGIRLATAALRKLGEAEPARRAKLLKLRGRLSYQLCRPGFVEDLRAAVACLPADPPSTARASTLAELSKYVRLNSGIEEAMAAATESLAIARKIGDRAVEADALLTLSCVDIDYGGEIDAEAGAAARRVGESSLLLRVAVNESHFLEGAGRHEEAFEVARRGVELAGEHGLGRTHGTFLAINTAEPLVSLGRWDEALAALRQALDQDPPVSIRISLFVLAGEIATARGDFEAAEARLAPASETIWRKAQDYLAVARLSAGLRLAQGRPDEALRAAEAVLAYPGQSDDARYAWPVLTLAAAACAELGDRATIGGEPAYPKLAARAAGLTVRGPAEEAHRLTWLAESARVHGVLDRAAWAAAAAAWERIEQPYPLARALAWTAEAAVPAGDRKAAAAGLRRAAGIAAELGARPLLARIEDLARRSRLSLGGTASASAAPDPPTAGLTPRELEVLRLVAEGRSNRDIAAALFISAKTASVHVSNILAKLDVSGRGEAAAAAHRLGLVGRP